MSSKPLKMSFKEKNNSRSYMPKYKMPFLHILRSKGLDPFGQSNEPGETKFNQEYFPREMLI